MATMKIEKKATKQETIEAYKEMVTEKLKDIFMGRQMTINSANAHNEGDGVAEELDTFIKDKSVELMLKYEKMGNFQMMLSRIIETEDDDDGVLGSIIHVLEGVADTDGENDSAE